MNLEDKLTWSVEFDVLPTRDGGATGHANERQMLAVTPAGGIRTQLRDTPGGGTTLLRTRNGFPEFTAIDKTEAHAVARLRGFVVRAVSKLYGLMFWPIDMVKRKEPFKPVGHGYFVSQIVSSVNEKAAEGTKWGDVWSLDQDGYLKINNVDPATLGVVSTNHGVYGGVPYIVPAENFPYGAPTDNASPVKRAFAIGRDRVSVMTDGSIESPTEVLSPVAPRNDKKAMTLGPSIDPDTHSVRLSQLWYTGVTWDSLVGGWAISSSNIAMRLTPPYLTNITVTTSPEQPLVIPEFISVNDGTITASTTLPEVDICVVGVGETGTYTDTNMSVVFPWREVLKHSPPGTRTTAVSDSVWGKSSESTLDVAEVSITVSAANTLTLSARSDSLRVDAFDYDLPPMYSVTMDSDHGTFSTTSWSATWDGDTAQGVNLIPRGRDMYAHELSALPGSAQYTTRKQNGQFVVSADGVAVVSVAFSHSEEFGQEITPLAKPNRYAAALSNPYGWLGVSNGFGISSVLALTISTTSYVAPGSMLPALFSRANSFSGGRYYDYWDQDYADPLYTTNVGERPHQNIKSLSWETRDFILYDERDCVYIYVLGEFDASGTPGDWTQGILTVSIVVDSPAGVARMVLHECVFHYLDLLPLKALNETVYYVPSPRMTVMFTPKHREQGEFRGAAYTTVAEHVRGVTPACLVNFVLRMRSYDAVGQDDTAQVVDFVPCNLLELLYAYVFSGKYGVDENERYPVEYTNNFTQVMNSLFSTQYRVVFKDGAFFDWIDTFDGAYKDEQTQELYRT